jgi:hypothetical protein
MEIIDASLADEVHHLVKFINLGRLIVFLVAPFSLNQYDHMLYCLYILFIYFDLLNLLLCLCLQISALAINQC